MTAIRALLHDDFPHDAIGRPLPWRRAFDDFDPTRSLMVPTVLKIALIAFLVVGLGILISTFIRRSRARGFPTPQSSGHFWQIKGAMPPTPKPDWVDIDGDDEDPARRR